MKAKDLLAIRDVIWGHSHPNLWEENEKLYYVSVLSDTAKKMPKM